MSNLKYFQDRENKIQEELKNIIQEELKTTPVRWLVEGGLENPNLIDKEDGIDPFMHPEPPQEVHVVDKNLMIFPSGHRAGCDPKNIFDTLELAQAEYVRRCSKYTLHRLEEVLPSALVSPAELLILQAIQILKEQP